MRLPSLLLATAVVSQLGATDCGQITSDPGFDLWCGDALCDWTVERGAIKRVSTWHDGDAGVELLGPDTAIAQDTEVDSNDGTCIRFELISNVDETADVELNVDINADGTVERSERLPTSHWKQLSYNFAVKAPYTGIRFELARTGTGAGTVARILAQVVDASSCTGLTPLDGGVSAR